MKNIRIIPRLDIKGPNVVKGIHLEGLRVLGKPEDFAKFYYENGADELLYMDVVASLYGRNSLNNIIKETSKSLFVPLTVGGGLRTIEDINTVLRAGADKVVLNTAVIQNPNLIKEASKKFGSSTIVIAIEAIQQEGGHFFAFTDNGREFTGKEVVSWAKEVVELGAGELLITSVDREGTGTGYDISLLNEIASQVDIPLIAHGGAGKKEDVLDLLLQSDVDGVAISSLFHYETINSIRTVLADKNEGNKDFLNSGGNFTKIQALTIPELKEFLHENGINLRL
jgi:cyclase